MTDLAKPLIYDQIIGSSLSPSLSAIAELIVPGSRVLDVGCASGYFGAWLQANRGCSVVGVDYSHDAVEVARQRGLDAFQIDLERDQLDSTGFDAVIFADVLEHLRDPEAVLRSVFAPRVLISLPNIAHWSARMQIARGNFPSADFGLFDRTHLRYFTLKTARRMIMNSGFEITSDSFNFDPLPLQGVVRGAWRVGMLMAPHWPNLFGYQVIFDTRRVVKPS